LLDRNLVIADPTTRFLEFWDLEGHMQNRYETGIEVHKIAANEQFICLNQNENLCLLNVQDGQVVREWKAPHCNGLAIDEDLIYVSSLDSIYVYSLEGKLVYQWDLQAPQSQLARRLAIYENEIFLVDHAYACVQVYNPKGKLLRSWGKRGKKPGEFQYPWGIAVIDGIVFVVDAGNYRIQAFNVEGSFLFECSPPKPPSPQRRDLADICAYNDTLFVTDWNRQVLVFPLNYS